MKCDLVPHLVISDSSLLYAPLSVSALHVSEAEPQNLSLRAVQQNYLHLAVHSYCRGVNDLDANNVDVACFTSVLIVMNIYARLQDRGVGLSYEPPVQRLRMSNGLKDMFQTANKRRLRGNPGVAVSALINSASSLLDPDALLAEGNRVEFAHLLRPVINRERCHREGCVEGEGDDDEEMYKDLEAREAYSLLVLKSEAAVHVKKCLCPVN